MARYAITVMPDPETPLWRTGSSILGYDAATGLDVPFPEHPAYHDPLSLAWSAEPRRFGFQALLKAPFALAEHATPAALTDEAAAFASTRASFVIDLKLSVVGNFLALVVDQPPVALQTLADDCVRHFEPLREPLSVEERERQHPDTLIQRQVENLDLWGSPYVFDDFQFHMPLTGALDPEERHKLEAVLGEILEEAQPLRFTVNALTLTHQADNDGRFTVEKEFRFAG